jgi:hypothetical protein
MNEGADAPAGRMFELLRKDPCFQKLVAYPRQNRLWRKGETDSLYEQPGVHPVNSFVAAAVPAAFLLIFTSGPKMSPRESNRLV